MSELDRRPSRTPEAGRVRTRSGPLSILIGLEGLALGGCPINALDLGRALRGRGHAVRVFAIDEDVKVSLMPYAAAHGFEPVLLPPRGGIVGRVRQIRALAREVDADVVHVFGPWLGPAASVAAASRPGQAAVVTNWTMENVYFTPRYTPVVVGTKHLADDLRSRWPGRVWVMEPPVDLVGDRPNPTRGIAFRAEHDLSPDLIVSVVVTRVDSHMKAESLGHAIEACGRLANPRLRLVIVGDGDAFADISDRAARANARLGWPAVILTGALDDPCPAYDAADIALGMGGSALRALAHGKPLIVLGENGFARRFDATTAPYFYDEGFFGTQPERDPAGHLAAELDRLIRTDQRPALGAFGLGEVQHRFGLDVMAARLERIYGDTLRSLPRPAARLGHAGYVTARTLAHQARRWSYHRGVDRAARSSPAYRGGVSA